MEDGSRVYLSKPVFVYVLESDQAVKIGISTNTGNRVKSLQVGHSDEIRAVWQYKMSRDQAFSVENTVHKRLQKRGIKRRGEWFRLSSEDAVAEVITVLRSLGLLTTAENFVS
jgi:hypothetical protein